MSFFSSITGRAQAKAAEKAALAQENAAIRGADAVTSGYNTARSDLTPYAEFGAGSLPMLQQLQTAQGQSDYLQNHPLFQNALGLVNEQSAAAAAARGMGGSGGFANELMRNYLATAMPFLQNQQNNLFNAAQMGQNAGTNMANAAMNAGTQKADLFTQIGNAQAGGIMGAANAKAAGVGNMIGLAGAALGGFGSFGGLLGGGGAAGSSGAGKSLMDIYGAYMK